MSCRWSRKSRLHNWHSLDLPRNSHKNFQDLELWPGVYRPTSILNRKACLSCVNIYLNMHSKLCWTKCCQHLDKMFNMLLIPLSNYMFLSVLAPGIDCLNAKLLKADTVNTESILLPLEKTENTWRLESGNHHQDTKERSFYVQEYSNWHSITSSSESKSNQEMPITGCGP